MKTCTTCHLVYEDRFIFCTRDGTTLDSSINATSKRKIKTQNIGSDTVVYRSANTQLRVMYCPACAMEYPLTFTSCPSDNMPLREKKPRPVAALAQSAQIIEERAAIPEEPVLEIPAYIDSPVEVESEVESMEIQAVSEESLRSMHEPVYETEEKISSTEEYYEQPVLFEPALEVQTSFEPVRESKTSGVFEDYYSATPKGYDTAPLGAANQERESRAMQMAAKALMIGLAAIALIAFYLVYNAGSPSPVSESPIPQEMLVAQAPVFIPTPEEARNYSEEPAENPSDEPVEEDNEKGDQPIRIGQAKSNDTISKKPSQFQPPARETVPVTNSEVRAPREVETGPVIPQSTGGQIASRLVRTRSNRIGSGVRYDLTFALEEQTGRIVKWDRMQISTRSARGVNQSQMVPFYHRQGASGSLTFTVSVEMKGGSDSDWRGRVICTTLGTDDRGRTMQARFGATVAP